MPRRTNRPAHRVLASAVLAIGVVALARADEVRLVPGSSVTAPGGLLRGAVEKETPNDLTIAGKTVPLDQIVDVEYDNVGANLPQAILQENNGKFAEAADQYAKAAIEASAKPFAVQAAKFYRARALAKLADLDPTKRDAAVKELDTLAASLSRGRHYGPILELLAQQQLAAGKYDAADQALQKLSQLSWAADRASVLRARVQAKQGKNQEALEALDRLVGSTPEGSSQRREAQLARAEALAGLGRHEDAEQAVREVIDGAQPEDAPTLSAAYNTLGDCLAAAGRDRDALFAYLHTDILYPQDPEQHARSLSRIAVLWGKLGQPSRSNAVLDRLRQAYPNSPHLAEAQRPAS